MYACLLTDLPACMHTYIHFIDIYTHFLCTYVFSCISGWFCSCGSGLRQRPHSAPEDGAELSRQMARDGWPLLFSDATSMRNHQEQHVFFRPFQCTMICSWASETSLKVLSPLLVWAPRRLKKGLVCCGPYRDWTCEMSEIYVRDLESPLLGLGGAAETLCHCLPMFQAPFDT